MPKKKIGIPKCPKCGSAMIHYRITTKEYVCRRCGHVFKEPVWK